MKCPVCKDRNHVEVNQHSDGYCENIRECGTCGTVWGWKEGERFILTEGKVSEVTELKARLSELEKAVDQHDEVIKKVFSDIYLIMERLQNVKS